MITTVSIAADQSPDMALLNLGQQFEERLALYRAECSDLTSDAHDEQFLKPINDVRDRIAAIPAVSLAGLAIKARAACTITLTESEIDPHDFDGALEQSLMGDLLSIWRARA